MVKVLGLIEISNSKPTQNPQETEPHRGDITVARKGGYKEKNRIAVTLQ